MADEVPIPNTEFKPTTSQLPAVEISDAFTERFHWSYSSDARSLTEIPHQFSEDMVEEIQGAAALAFERAMLKDANVQSITLFCPHEGGHPHGETDCLSSKSKCRRSGCFRACYGAVRPNWRRCVIFRRYVIRLRC